MKKKQLQSLQLNKKVISNLYEESILGGSSTLPSRDILCPGSVGKPCPSIQISCPPEICPSLEDTCIGGDM